MAVGGGEKSEQAREKQCGHTLALCTLPSLRVVSLSLSLPFSIARPLSFSFSLARCLSPSLCPLSFVRSLSLSLSPLRVDCLPLSLTLVFLSLSLAFPPLSFVFSLPPFLIARRLSSSLPVPCLPLSLSFPPLSFVFSLPPFLIARLLSPSCLVPCLPPSLSFPPSLVFRPFALSLSSPRTCSRGSDDRGEVGERPNHLLPLVRLEVVQLQLHKSPHFCCPLS